MILRTRVYVALSLCVLSVAAFGAKPARKALVKEAAKPVQEHPGSRILPAPLALESLYPDLSPVQKLPMMTPAGIEPLYSRTDWEIYREFFGKDADDVGKKKASEQIAFARKLLGAGEKETQRQGLRRLLALRAIALTMRHKDAFPVTVRGVKLFRQSLDVNSPSHIAGLFTAAQGIWRRSETPRDQRPHYSILSARCSVQLALLLTDLNQLEAAQAAIRQVGMHEISLKKEPDLKSDVASVRALVSQSVVMTDYVSERYSAMLAGDTAAAMPVYAYARYAHPDAEMMNQALKYGSQGAVGALNKQLADAQKDPMATFAAGEMLQNIARNVPEGILRHRVLYAALQQYRAFMAADATADERIKRTRARIAIEGVISDGARGKPIITPFADEHDVDLSIAEPPEVLIVPASRPATSTAPATTRGAVLAPATRTENVPVLKTSVPEIRVDAPASAPASMPAVKPVLVEITPGRGAAVPATQPR